MFHAAAHLATLTTGGHRDRRVVGHTHPEVAKATSTPETEQLFPIRHPSAISAPRCRRCQHPMRVRKHTAWDKSHKSNVRRAQHSASLSAGPMQAPQQANPLSWPFLRPTIRVVAGHILPEARSTTTPTRETLLPAIQHPSAQVRVETPLVCEQGMPKVVGYLGNTCCSQFDSKNTLPALLPAAGPAMPFQQRFFQHRVLQWLTRLSHGIYHRVCPRAPDQCGV